VSCFLEWLGLDPNSKRMLDDKTKMLVHHERKMGNNAVPIFQHAVNEDLKLFIKVQAQISLAVYAMHEVIV
jgi:hypothetical protein